jgi:hypothetical protein
VPKTPPQSSEPLQIRHFLGGRSVFLQGGCGLVTAPSLEVRETVGAETSRQVYLLAVNPGA